MEEEKKIILTPEVRTVEFRGITFKIPKVEEITEEQIKFYKAIFGIVEDKKNWKLPTRPVEVTNLESAFIVADAIQFFAGGAEIELIREEPPLYRVTSRGYYHYVGA